MLASCAGYLRNIFVARGCICASMVHNGYMNTSPRVQHGSASDAAEGSMEATRTGGHTMAVHSSTQLANGHTLTLVEGDTYRVEERNELGTFLHVAFTAYRFGDCEAWIARAVERGYGLRPTLGRDAGEVRVAGAELLILETYNVLRIAQGHDFGCGQRHAELSRRRRELAGRDASRELLNAVAEANTGAFTPDELSAAWKRVGAPKLRRAEREREMYGSRGVVRTLDTWRRVSRRFDAKAGR